MSWAEPLRGRYLEHFLGRNKVCAVELLRYRIFQAGSPSARLWHKETSQVDSEALDEGIRREVIVLPPK